MALPPAHVPTDQEAQVQVAPGDSGGEPGEPQSVAPVEVSDGDDAAALGETPPNGDAAQVPAVAVGASLTGEPGTDSVDPASPVSITLDGGQDGAYTPELIFPEPSAPGPAYPEAVFLPGASADVEESIAVGEWGAVDFRPFVDIGGKDLGMAETGVYRTETPDEALSYYRGQLRDAGWTLHADVGDAGHALMYMRDDQVLIMSELDQEQMRYLGEDSDGFIVVTLERYYNPPPPFDSPVPLILPD